MKHRVTEMVAVVLLNGAALQAWFACTGSSSISARREGTVRISASRLQAARRWPTRSRNGTRKRAWQAFGWGFHRSARTASQPWHSAMYRYCRL